MKKRIILITKNGFSLAEVLITLTVIGIAVALTMPMLKNYLSHRYITAARTTYYDVEKILRSIQSELGPYESWGYVDKEFADKYIDNRIAYVKKQILYKTFTLKLEVIL